MRLPGKYNVDDEDSDEDRPHFLTHHYIKKFGKKTKIFPNYDKNELSNIYGLQKKTTGMYISRSVYSPVSHKCFRAGLKSG